MKTLKAALLLAFSISIAVVSYGQDNKVSANKFADNIERITVEELKAKVERGDKIVILDVRGGDYDSSSTKIRGAVRIAPADLQSRLGEIPHDREIITYCACSTDGGAVKAAETLLANGFKQVRALRGGWNAWTQAGGPVEQKEVATSR